LKKPRTEAGTAGEELAVPPSLVPAHWEGRSKPLPLALHYIAASEKLVLQMLPQDSNKTNPKHTVVAVFGTAQGAHSSAIAGVEGLPYDMTAVQSTYPTE
jgi:hypothetical protein